MMSYKRPQESLLLPEPELPAADVKLLMSLYEAYGTDKEPYQELSLPPERKQAASSRHIKVLQGRGLLPVYE